MNQKLPTKLHGRLLGRSVPRLLGVIFPHAFQKMKGFRGVRPIQREQEDPLDIGGSLPEMEMKLRVRLLTDQGWALLRKHKSCLGHRSSKLSLKN